ncbi:NAD(+) diphosphatase [Ruminococcus sp.]|uniref:NAD(+) diphosphatase n=1 Tax=Ruminococcus sp. TaxID=41978 RepID=UPI0025DC00D0|nr:NAD(+) diphosphatase [Ruminococcus sp.]
MIQDIYPSRLDNSFRRVTPSECPEKSFAVCFKDGRILADTSGRDVIFPRVSQVSVNAEIIYLFAIDDESFFLVRKNEDSKVKNGSLGYYTIRELRDKCRGKYLFAAFTAFHLAKWYDDNRFCGKCGGKTEGDDTERALVCINCGNKVYPRINPAVIVGVINGDRILITRYRSGFAHNALIAGFTEIGETLEQTVQREVMEEAGLRVKNIRYYKSQPWGMASDILVGFYCDVDGKDTIKMDESELKYAEWVSRENIELQPYEHSLTNEMMKIFKNGEVS